MPLESFKIHSIVRNGSGLNTISTAFNPVMVVVGLFDMITNDNDYPSRIKGVLLNVVGDYCLTDKRANKEEILCIER